MDDRRFDALARRLAARATRRSLVRAAIAGAAAAAGLGIGRAGAKPDPVRCRADARNCATDGQCCSGYCRHPRRAGHGVCAPCASGIVCGDLCCPANALNGCTVTQGPDGPSVGCLCPEHTAYLDGVCVSCGDLCDKPCCAADIGCRCAIAAGGAQCGACACPPETTELRGTCVPCTAPGCACDDAQPCCEGGFCCGGRCFSAADGYACCHGEPCCVGGGRVCDEGGCRCPGTPEGFCPACDQPICLGSGATGA